MPENKLKQEEKINTKKQNFTNVSDNSNKRLRKKNSKSKNNEQPGNIELNNENVPNYGLNEQLEHIPEAYDYLEYINVEYPSQTICEINGNNLLFSQCNGSNSSLILANFKDLNANAQFTYDKMTVDSEINRIRRNNSVIVANSDHKGYIFNSEFNLRCEIHKSLSYGLDVTQEKAYFGTQAGKTIIFDLKDDKKQTIQIHNQGIDGLKCQDTLLYTASNDSTLKITDLRTEKQIRTIQNDSDINSVDVKDNFFIFGDNNGILYHCDLRNEKIKEEIKWHNSAINSVYFATDSIFASVSDEQVALFDTNLVEEEGWTAHHWLWFVHRGQKFYKEICVLEDKWAVTSADGIAIFKPVEALDDDLEESESEE